MSSIKPPDGQTPAPSLDPSAGASGSDAVGQTAFRELVNATTAAETPVASQGVGGAASADAIAQLAEAIRGGALSREQALDALVERAVVSMSRALTEEQRAELAFVLREALESDPALGDLRAALG